MRTIPTLLVGALALGLFAFGPSHDKLHTGRSVFTPTDQVGAVVTPMPDFFGSILTTR